MRIESYTTVDLLPCRSTYSSKQLVILQVWKSERNDNLPLKRTSNALHNLGWKQYEFTNVIARPYYLQNTYFLGPSILEFCTKRVPQRLQNTSFLGPLSTKLIKIATSHHDPATKPVVDDLFLYILKKPISVSFKLTATVVAQQLVSRHHTCFSTSATDFCEYAVLDTFRASRRSNVTN